MGKCPWCAKSMEKLAQNITCDFQCTRSDEVLTLLASPGAKVKILTQRTPQEGRPRELKARLDFQLHMVGLNNGTFRRPWLR